MIGCSRYSLRSMSHTGTISVFLADLTKSLQEQPFMRIKLPDQATLYPHIIMLHWISYVVQRR